MSGFKSLLGMMNLTDSEYDDGDDFEETEEDFEEDFEEPAPKKAKKSRFSTSRKEKKSRRPEPVYNDYDEEEDEEEYEEPAPKPAKKHTHIPGKNNNLVEFRASGSNMMGVHVARPLDFDSAQYISDMVISGIPVIINYEQLSPADAQRVIDFIGGAVYATSGNLRLIKDDILIATPATVSLDGDFDELKNSDMIVPNFSYLDEED